jgi:lipopolysaccharide transport system ATP-binding protein
MQDPAIRVEKLSKLYRLGMLHRRHDTLRDALVAAVRAPIERLTDHASRSPHHDDTIWALQDVSFEVKRGEVLGIIGRNGAGKSTLLKILSRITEPTEGRAEIHGRVGSLLEVGTGFHQELTGRENIYLSGAILGMHRREIERKFDEIVDFSGVAKFIDTPIKRYSSGMNVRLGFSVAAHLEPEILLIDEVLAVGDAQFQKKCLGKMGEVAEGGRTVLFVSHNMVAVQSLCSRAIWLDEGRLRTDGPAGEVVSGYLRAARTATTTTQQFWQDKASAPGNDRVRLHGIRVRPENGVTSELISMNTPFVIEVQYWNLVPDAHLHVTLHLQNEQGVKVLSTFPVNESNWHGHPFPAGLFQSVCHVPGDLLNSGAYSIMILIVQDQSRVIFRYEDAMFFDIVDTAERAGWFGREPGVVQPRLTWETRLVEAHGCEPPPAVSRGAPSHGPDGR